MKNFYSILISLLVLSSCSSRLYTGNGAIHNANFSTDEYKIKEISLSQSGTSYFGVPINQKSEDVSGFVFSFNGIQISKVPALVPALTLLAFTLQSGQLISSMGIGTKEESWHDHRTPNIASYILGLPIAATANSLLWRGSSKGAAGSEINNQMLIENPDVDMFLFPKYTTQTEGFYIENSLVELRVKTATLKD